MKKLLWLFVIMFLCGVMIFAVLFYHARPPMRFLRSNDNFDEDTNTAIKALITNLMRAHYGAYCKERYEWIFTESLAERVREDSRFTNLREGQRLVRFIDRNFMHSLQRIATNNDGSELFLLYVRVNEGLLLNPFTLIHQITIVRKYDGSYFIYDIEYDT